MTRIKIVDIVALLSIGAFAATAGAQSFGAAKSKVTLQRKLPALAHMRGSTFKVKVTGHDNQVDLTHDLEAQLATELMKNDPNLQEDETNPATIITCQITEYAHPQPTLSVRPSVAVTKNAPKTQTYTRVTGALSVAFQAKTAGGETLTSDNVSAKYDEEFDSSGNKTSQGMFGAMTSSWNKLKGGASAEEYNPPTDAELRAKLLTQAVHQISEHLVNTNEVLEVFLAKGKGSLDDGDKLAEAGLWQRALETFETAPPLQKVDEDAYRLYDIGVAYEALAYASEDEKAAMKFLDEAAINFGKAIDSKPAEKYFLEPQKRIETAIAHYKELEDEQRRKAEAEEELRHPKAPVEPVANSKPAPAAGTGAKPAASKGLSNAQVVAMVKAGMDDDTIVQAIRVSKAASFDLTAAGQQQLTSDGVSPQVEAAMKARAARKAVAAK